MARHPDGAVRRGPSGERPGGAGRMPFQNVPTPADTPRMSLRISTLDRIAGSFADAVAVGDFEAAEGWLATARYVARREADRRPVVLERRRTARRIRLRTAG